MCQPWLLLLINDLIRVVIELPLMLLIICKLQLLRNRRGMADPWELIDRDTCQRQTERMVKEGREWTKTKEEKKISSRPVRSVYLRGKNMQHRWVECGTTQLRRILPAVSRNNSILSPLVVLDKITSSSPGCEKENRVVRLTKFFSLDPLERKAIENCTT